MGTKITIYLLLYPLSLLPMPFLYGIARIMKFFMYPVFRYRVDVVRTNMRRAFPSASSKELIAFEKTFYSHLANLIVEGIKMLSMSRQQVRTRYVCKNPELVNQYFDQQKSVILLSSHYNNWEWMVLSLNMQFKHQGIGVGKENTNKSFEEVINRFRTRYGTEVIFAKTIREAMKQYDTQNKLCAYMMLSDQAPANAKKSFILSFLNQPSDMIYGGEYFALKYNYPVLYYVVKQKRKGYYEIELELICDDPSGMEYGDIIRAYVQRLERDINQKPSYWLWSHKRWKHKVVLPN